MKLSRRESVFLAVGVAVVLLVAAEEWVFRPLWQRRHELRVRTQRAERQLRTLRTLLARHRRYSARLREVEPRLIRKGDNFSLFSFLEEAAGRTGIREKLVAMNPSESSGSEGYRRHVMLIRFEDLTMQEMVGYLQRLARAPRLLRVSRLSVERSARRPGRVKVTATVLAFSVQDTR